MEGHVLNAYELLVTGEWLAALRHRLIPGISAWDKVKECLDYLSKTLKNARHFEFIGEEANHLIIQFSRKYYKPNACLDSTDHQKLMSTLARWEGRLQEISRDWILSYPETHINISKLSKGPVAFLSKEECIKLEPLEIYELVEATSSLLQNNFTSAEFMALRTAESLLKKWYEKRTGKKLGRTTWGQVLDKLNKEFPEQERPKELHLLDYLRERRNEIAHSGAVSNSVAASTTFLNVISLYKSLI
jgi:hypothetical protein